jgi:hypothetical protein
MVTKKSGAKTGKKSGTKATKKTGTKAKAAKGTKKRLSLKKQPVGAKAVKREAASVDDNPRGRVRIRKAE